MKTHARTMLMVAPLLLAVAGCDGSTVAPDPVAPDAVPLYGKAIWHWCKPHLAVNAEEPDRTLQLVAIAPDQRVDVDLGDHETEGRFGSQLLVWADGSACGQASLEFAIRDETGSAEIIVIVIAFTEATARVEDGRTRVDFTGMVEICPERGEECEILPMTGSVGEQPIDDDPIWQFHGPGVYTPSVPARTRFVAPGSDDSRSVHGSFPLQEVEELRPRSGASRPLLFEAEFEVGPAGTATGRGLLLDITDPANPQIQIGFTIREGRFAVGPNGVVLVWLSGILDVVDGRTVDPASFVATVSQQRIDDDPIWQFHAGDVYSNSFPVRGDLRLQ
jgi:hypothetical protein